MLKNLKNKRAILHLWETIFVITKKNDDMDIKLLSTDLWNNQLHIQKHGTPWSLYCPVCKLFTETQKKVSKVLALEMTKICPRLN